jgi:Fe-S cluster assembly ATPase SufC
VTGVHAACVERNGVGVLLCGDSGAGKSTLAYACAKAGWTYITDDGSYMVHGPGDVLVTGNCHQMRFRPTAASIFPEIAGLEITQRAQSGKPSIVFSSATLPGIRCSQTATIKYAVFLNRRQRGNLPLRHYSKEVVRKFLCQARFSPMDKMPEHFAAIDKLLELEVLQLPYNDLAWAVEQLDSLVENGAP